MKKKNILKTISSFWTSEKILGACAMIISISTLIVFAYQTNLMRKQQYMSVYPYLMFADYAVYSPQYKFVLHNNGIGPALIISTKIIDNGKVKDYDIVNYIQSIIKPEDSINYLSSNVYRGLLIPENGKVELIALYGENTGSGIEKIYNLIHNENLEFIIEYESIYGEKWIISTKSRMPDKIE